MVGKTEPTSTSFIMAQIKFALAEVESPAISNCKLVQKKSEHKDSREDLMVDVDIVDRQQDDVSKPNHSLCGIVE